MKPWAMMRRFGEQSSGPIDGDPYWSNVVSLLNFPGEDGSTAIIDAKGKMWTAYGDAKIDTSLGYNTCKFDGVGDYIQTPNAGDFALESDSFCIEGIVQLSSHSVQQTLIEKRSTGYTTGDWVVFVLSGEIQAYFYDVSSAGSVAASASLSGVSEGSQFHWALVRNGEEWRIYINGVPGAARTSSAAIAASSTPLTVGRDEFGGGRFYLNGRYRALRVTKGVARYTATFTPPDAPFPDFGS